jgi:hypothetical protein
MIKTSVHFHKVFDVDVNGIERAAKVIESISNHQFSI